MNSYRGFTLIELLMTVSVMAIIATWAVPSFQTVMESNRVSTSANSLLSGLQLARSEASRRGGVVSVCALDDDWSQGFAVAADPDCSGETFKVVHFSRQLQVADNCEALSVTYWPDGTIDGAGCEFTFNGGSQTPERTLTLWPAGHAQIEIDS